jgi:hypothetical protein
VGVERAVDITADGNQTVLIPASRVAAKLTVKVRKATDNPADSFTITDASLGNVPSWQHLLPGQTNSAADLAAETLFADRSYEFTANGNDYTTIVDGLILPEYLLAEPGNETLATSLNLRADYRVGGAIFPTGWELPLLGGTNAQGDPIESLSLRRDTYYTVCVTISRLAGFDYYITTSVADWEDTGGSGVRFEEVITFSPEWADATEFEESDDGEPNTVIVRLTGAARFLFTLSNPTAEWTAHLTDNVNFRFDTAEGVSGGFTRPADPYLIVIRPVGEVASRTETEFYITVSDGTRTVELDLNENEGSGPGERYVIAQTPN